MFINTSNNAFIKLLKDFNKIDSVNDLTRRNLTLACKTDLECIIISLYENGETSTIHKEVADHCKKFGLKVKPKGIGWRISL
jgi:hypothetical protein